MEDTKYIRTRITPNCTPCGVVSCVRTPSIVRYHYLQMLRSHLSATVRCNDSNSLDLWEERAAAYEERDMLPRVFFLQRAQGWPLNFCCCCRRLRPPFQQAYTFLLCWWRQWLRGADGRWYVTMEDIKSIRTRIPPNCTPCRVVSCVRSPFIIRYHYLQMMRSHLSATVRCNDNNSLGLWEERAVAYGERESMLPAVFFLQRAQGWRSNCRYVMQQLLYYICSRLF
jgi:hypothetical protein